MIKVADEVWIATALLHREHPDRSSFRVREIVDRARAARLSETLRPGVQVHASLHCVANKRPNPGNYRMLYAPPEGGRRLFRPGDDYHPDRRAGKTVPRAADMPPEHRSLLDWYEVVFVRRPEPPDRPQPVASVRHDDVVAGGSTSRVRDAVAGPDVAKEPRIGVAVKGLRDRDRDRDPASLGAPSLGAPAAGTPSLGAPSAPRRIGLVSCVKSKRSHAAPARELYASPLFARSRAWAERECDAWYVLSAKYGLVRPGAIIEPYEFSLNQLPPQERRAWARRVYLQMREEGLLAPGVSFVWLAGRVYKEPLSRMLSAHPQEDPLANLRIGKRLQRLAEGPQASSGGGPRRQPARSPSAPKRPWELALELAARIPPDELAHLPSDLAEQHDHYAWGAARR